MTTSPSSGLSAEAKEFVPLVQTTPASIPLYVDENTVATIYSSEQVPFMIQTIYPMMISNTKMADLSSNNLLPVPEIEFHIQPSQQQQFHIDSCATIVPTSSSNTSQSTNHTSQIVLLPTTSTNSATNLSTAVTPTGYYPGPPILYSPSDPTSGFYPIDFCEQPLINFSLQQQQQQQQPTMMNKSNRISSQQQHQGSLQRPSSFRQQYGNNPLCYRTNHRGGGGGGSSGNSNPNRTSYYEYHSRRNGTTYPSSYSGRGNGSNSKRISSSYHQQDYNHYYHHPSSRSRGYAASRSSQYHDEQRKDQVDYYNHEKDYYENDYPISTDLNDDGTLFEFRPEDFPSLPINQPNDKTPTPTVPTTKSVSSWNTIVSAPRPHSTSPHSVPPTLSQSHDQRSDRSRSFNTKVPSTNERKTLNNNNNDTNNSTTNKKQSFSTIISANKSKSPPRASKSVPFDEENQAATSVINSAVAVTPVVDDNESKDDGFIQTKQQQRRLKRKNRIKEETMVSPSTDLRSDNHSTNIPNETSAESMGLTDRLARLQTSTEIQRSNSDRNSSAILKNVNVQPERDQQDQLTKANETDSRKMNVIKGNDQNLTTVTSNMNNSSDTSDYDDAVDNLTDE